MNPVAIPNANSPESLSQNPHVAHTLRAIKEIDMTGVSFSETATDVIVTILPRAHVSINYLRITCPTVTIKKKNL